MQKTIITHWLRKLSFFIILSITITLLTGFTETTSKAGFNIANPEIKRAYELGITNDEAIKNPNAAITGEQFCTMLGRAINLHNKNLVSNWKYVAKNGYMYNKPLLQQDGMLAVLYAAKVMGIAEYNKGNLSEEESVNFDEIWSDVFSHEHPMFPDWQRTMNISWDKDLTHMTAAVLFSMRRTSNLSQLSIFTVDSSFSKRISYKLTNKDAVLAAVRLYDSTLSQQQVSEILKKTTQTDYDKQFLKNAEERKSSILSSKTAVTVTGRKYYVSRSGNDSNDGLSESSAWATLDKVNQTKFSAGDGVFFQRNGLWRGHLKAQSGITYSAYGSGEKPLIYGSPENGADASKWKLVDGSNSIWVFYKNMPACSTMVFNKDERVAVKELPSFVNGKYVLNTDQKTPFNIFKELDKNLEFFSEADKFANDRRSEPKAKLYLRCESGNPGKVFNSIEFLSGTDSVWCWSLHDVTFDNLHFKYSGECGIGGGGNSSNITVQNCMLGYIGGVVIAYNADNYAVTAGDAIRIDGTNNHAINNYVYQIYDYGMTSETGDFLNFAGDKTPQRNITYKGNLIENCSGGMLIINWDQKIDPDNLIESIVVEDNYLIHCGYGWGYNNHLKDNNYNNNNNDINLGISLSFFEAPNANKGIYIKNNVFYMSRGRLLWGKMDEKYKPIFSGNTYVQNCFGILAKWKPVDKQHMVTYGDLLNNAESFIRDIIKDNTGKLIIVQ